ncbi:hypothetical protein K0M31_018299 [Melipona bicolor]|uniref:Uncharacterized protein n=1 Tax=Melipona bicolor TaxID=60889 RepID=A0AA40FCP8_9HYME|nr:hypothetical protein K0M31_018299 [Melipona bicolor]
MGTRARHPPASPAPCAPRVTKILGIHQPRESPLLKTAKQTRAKVGPIIRPRSFPKRSGFPPREILHSSRWFLLIRRWDRGEAMVRSSWGLICHDMAPITDQRQSWPTSSHDATKPPSQCYRA